LYFKNKDEILISIFEEEMAKFIAKANKEMASTDDVVGKIKKFVYTHLSFVKKNPRLAQVFQLELRQSNKFIKEYNGLKISEYLDIIGTVIEQGQRERQIRGDLHPSLVKRALFGALDEIATHWVLLKNGKYDLDSSAEQIAEIFIAGVALERGKRSSFREKTEMTEGE
ncbi:hypothetical protein MJD09_00350, partial [bacterium]|nr:hypothetical protein [bacterium]